LDSLWVITVLFVGVITWMIYAHLNKQKAIEKYLENADPILFQKMGNNIDVAFQAPRGSFIQPYTLMVVDQQRSVVAQENDSKEGYISENTPDISSD